MVRALTLYGSAGTSIVSDSRLAYVKRIIKVQRSGVQHDPDFPLEDAFTLYPTGRKYYWRSSTGELYFSSDNPFNQGETIKVIYDTL